MPKTLLSKIGRNPKKLWRCLQRYSYKNDNRACSRIENIDSEFLTFRKGANADLANIPKLCETVNELENENANTKSKEILDLQTKFSNQVKPIKQNMELSCMMQFPKPKSIAMVPT